MHAQELWTSASAKARVLRTLLTPASWLYAIGWQGYLTIYRLGFKKAKRPHSPVVCVGNLQVGGTGKTPFTVHVADVLAALGHEVVVSCSGYGSPAAEAARVAPEGPLRASEWGDEAALFRDLRPEIPLIVGRRRVLAGELCHEHFPDAVLLMDDGFQHLPLAKDIAIVLDPEVPNRRCLPAGPYREPWANRRRADLIVPGEFSVAVRPQEFLDRRGSAVKLPGKVDVLCGLGQPQRFLDGLRQAGVDLGEVLLMPDHDPLTTGNLLSAFSGTRPIVVTGKDWVKLRERTDTDRYEFLIATREVVVEPQAEFREWLRTKLNGISRTKKAI